MGEQRSNNNSSSDLQMLQMSDRLLKSAIAIGEWRSDLETTDFTQALLNFGYEVLKVNPTVDATNGTEVSNWIETLLEGGDVKMAAAGMSDFLSGMVGRTEKIKALEYGDRLIDAAAGIQDSSLRGMVLRSDTLSELVNLGGAYAALNPRQSSNGSFFLNTLWSNGAIDKASIEFETYLKSYNGADKKQVIQVEQNLLEILGKLPSTYARQQFRESLTVQTWMEDMVNYLNLKNTLRTGEYIFDPSTFYESVITASNSQKSSIAANEIYAYAKPNEILVASSNNTLIIAQDNIWDGAADGIGSVIRSIIGGIIGWLFIDTGGQISRVVFQSNGKPDDRTEGEKQTDKAIGKLLEGSVPLDKQGRPLKPGQKVSGAQNFAKPGGETERDQEFGDFAQENGTTPFHGNEGGKPRQTIETADGGIASTYNDSTSKDIDGMPYPTIEIRPSRGRGLGKVIKVRYTNRFRATILIPTL